MQGALFALLLAANSTDGALESAPVVAVNLPAATCRAHADNLNATGSEAWAFCLPMHP